jgi:uncharacterized membrane protein YhdT
MHRTSRTAWIWSMLAVATIYVVVGIVTADLAGSASTPRGVTGWRQAAWLLSIVVFIGNLVYDHVRFRNAARDSAVHVAAAVALATFVLAAVGPVRSHWGNPDIARVALLSLPLWPILAGVPAFLVALLAKPILRRLIRDR